MILSDIQIKQLCTLPKYIDYASGKPHIPEDGQEGVGHRHTFLEEINDIGVVYRPIYDDEVKNFKPMISPFIDHQVKTDRNGNRILSYGTSSAGYDVRLSDEFKIFTNINNVIIDPLDFDPKCLYDHKGPYCIIPPNSYILGRTIEYFVIPEDIMVVCVGKSTYARCGAIVNVTPIEPGFEGNIVIEISNATSLPLKVYANQGISQFLFFKMNTKCAVSYADRNGKYQGQTDIKTAIG